MAGRKKKAKETVDVTDYTVALKFCRATPGSLPEFVVVVVNNEELETVPIVSGKTVKVLIGRKVPKAPEGLEKYAQ